MLVVPLKLSTVLFNMTIAPPPNAEPPNRHCLNVALLSRKVVLLLEAMIAPPSTMIQQALLCVNSVLPARVMSVLLTSQDACR